MRKLNLVSQFQLISAIREFFVKEGFTDVMTPPMVTNPGMETHIHPFIVGHTRTSSFSPWYLNTSPEFHMKELLSLGFENIFTIGYSFRDEPEAPNHRPQFLMLEWYRTKSHYTKIMKDCEALFQFSLESLQSKNIAIESSLLKAPIIRVTVQDLFLEFLNLDILNFLETKDLKELIEINFKDVPLPTQGEILSWDDYYFLLFLNKIEPHIAHYPFLLVDEFPYHLAALSTLKLEDPRVCERFEIYSHGVELCNCFNELRDLSIQKARFLEQTTEKEKIYGYTLPEPKVLYDALERGLPMSSGIAMGVERLLKVLTGTQNPFWK